MLLPKNYHAMSFNNSHYSILTDDGYKDFAGIARMSFSEELIKLTFDDGEFIICTHDHKLYIEKNKCECARSLNVGDKLYSPTHNITISSISNVHEKYVYDVIHVEDTNSYLVGKNYIKSSNCVYLDELAFVENDVEFYTATYPVISSGKKTKIIITSTPNGLNLFYKIWTEAAEKVSEFKNYKVHWSEHPDRDDAWAVTQITNTSPSQFEVEYNCSFQGSAGTLIKGAKLEQMTFTQPIRSSKEIHVYEEPIAYHKYVAIVDTGEGVGQDYSVVNIIDVTTTPYKQVFVYRDNNTVPKLFAPIAAKCATKYNTALLIVESNNSSGGIVTNDLWYEIEYENILMTKVEDSENVAGGAKSVPGVRTTKRTKSTGCAFLKDLVESDQLLIRDKETLSELSTFIRRNGTYMAERKKHDDIVMTLVIFAWFTQEPYFEEETGIIANLELQDALMSTNELNDVYGFISNGIDDDTLHEDINSSFFK